MYVREHCNCLKKKEEMDDISLLAMQILNCIPFL